MGCCLSEQVRVEPSVDIEIENDDGKRVAPDDIELEQKEVKELPDDIPLDAPEFSFAGERKLCRVHSVYDGDTFRLIFRVGNTYVRARCRAAGYDSPEMKPPKNSPSRDAEKKAALEAKKALEARFEAVKGLVWTIFGAFDKYGRPLATIYAGKDDKQSINDWMISNGYGKPYDGGKKSSFV